MHLSQHSHQEHFGVQYVYGGRLWSIWSVDDPLYPLTHTFSPLTHLLRCDKHLCHVFKVNMKPQENVTSDWAQPDTLYWQKSLWHLLWMCMVPWGWTVMIFGDQCELFFSCNKINISACHIFHFHVCHIIYVVLIIKGSTTNFNLNYPMDIRLIPELRRAHKIMHSRMSCLL